jgi:aminoglycoside/choline kinase family phosphotransferase
MHERESALKEWLSNTIQNKEIAISPLAGDASFRRYYRIQHSGLSQVVMDAPPDKENIEPFIQVASMLAEKCIEIPDVLAINKEKGFLLLRDLGDQLLLQKLTQETVNQYYQQALNLLLNMQQISTTEKQLPAFDKAFMVKEMNLCLEWFLKAYLKLNLSQNELNLISKSIDWIANEVAKQPIVFIHRDYHSRNIMLINNPKETLAIIDFQDAMHGPITYDLVSLLKDCYISWPRENVLEWVKYFYIHSALTKTYSESNFIRAFDLSGIQRHLKVLGVFSRLHLRDNKPGYLNDLPLTLNYLLECAEIYEELHPLFQFFQTRVFLP